MATSSIYDKVKISDSQVAEAFVRAIEESENAPKSASPVREVKMATREDAIKLHEMRKKQRMAI